MSGKTDDSIFQTLASEKPAENASSTNKKRGMFSGRFTKTIILLILIVFVIVFIISCTDRFQKWRNSKGGNTNNNNLNNLNLNLNNLNLNNDNFQVFSPDEIVALRSDIMSKQAYPFTRVIALQELKPSDERFELFYSKTCGPCTVFCPKFIEFLTTSAPPGFRFTPHNCQGGLDLACHSVSMIPSLIYKTCSTDKGERYDGPPVPSSISNWVNSKTRTVAVPMQTTVEINLEMKSDANNTPSVSAATVSADKHVHLKRHRHKEVIKVVSNDNNELSGDEDENDMVYSMQ